jgi:hypothetical protein
MGDEPEVVPRVGVRRLALDHLAELRFGRVDIVFGEIHEGEVVARRGEGGVDLERGDEAFARALQVAHFAQGVREPQVGLGAAHVERDRAPERREASMSRPVRRSALPRL